MSIESGEVNYLVYRYLLESGFTHAAFTFALESHVASANVNGSEVPSGSLISFIQKGILYHEAEVHLMDDGTEIQCNEPFSLLTPHNCKNGKRKSKDAKKDSQKKRMKKQSDSSMAPENGHTVVPVTDVLSLVGHEAEVFSCAWNPRVKSLIATASGDSTVCFYDISQSSNVRRVLEPLQVLRHLTEDGGKSKDVTSLEWNTDGTLLATASYEGPCYIWKREGDLARTLKKHSGPVFSLKWSRNGEKLLSGGADKTVIVWNAGSGTVIQQFNFHTLPVLDVAWRTELEFASCSMDQKICVGKLGETEPLIVFRGHMNEVNSIAWDPRGEVIASCSDDNTAKVWNLHQTQCMFDMAGHRREIYTIKWAPTGLGSANPDLPAMIATASGDCTVKLWELVNGTCVHSLTGHSQPVYTVSWSPDGKLIASGSFDRVMNVWSTKDGSLIKSYRGDGGIFEVQFNLASDKVAVCFSSGKVTIVDM